MEEGLSYSLSTISLVALLLIVTLALSSLEPALRERRCARLLEIRNELESLADSLKLDASRYLGAVGRC